MKFLFIIAFLPNKISSFDYNLKSCSVVPRSEILRAIFGPLLIFFLGGGGAFEIFEGHILPSVKHNPIRFFTKAELVPIICRDQASP